MEDKLSAIEMLIEAATARQEAARYHRAAAMVRDPRAEELLQARETEFLKLAESLEAQATKLMPP